MDTIAVAIGFGLPVLLSTLTVLVAFVISASIDQTFRVERTLLDEAIKDSLKLDALRKELLGLSLAINGLHEKRRTLVIELLGAIAWRRKHETNLERLKIQALISKTVVRVPSRPQATLIGYPSPRVA